MWRDWIERSPLALCTRIRGHPVKLVGSSFRTQKKKHFNMMYKVNCHVVANWPEKTWPGWCLCLQEQLDLQPWALETWQSIEMNIMTNSCWHAKLLLLQQLIEKLAALDVFASSFEDFKTEWIHSWKVSWLMTILSMIAKWNLHAQITWRQITERLHKACLWASSGHLVDHWMLC